MAQIKYALRGKEGEVQVLENKTIFDALEEKGIFWPHGCLAGACGACRSVIEEGGENLSPPSEVEKNTLDKIAQDLPTEKKNLNIRLVCRAKIKGNIKLRPL